MEDSKKAAPRKIVVKTRGQANRRALETGASVTGPSGERFNSAKQKAPEQKRLQPASQRTDLPEAKPEPPKPPEPDPGLIMVAQEISEGSKRMALLMDDLRAQMVASTMNQARQPTGWEFDFLRGKDKLLTKIVATAVYKRTVN